MKYVVVLGDGMAGYKMPAYDNKTCLMLANKPTIDDLAKKSEVGTCRTVPFGLKPGSDVANLSVLGYDPAIFYTGRSPLEAVSLGINISDTDVTYRCNLVTLSDDEVYENKTMLDYSSGEISTSDAAILIDYLKQHLDNDEMRLFAGISYRHCLLVSNGKTGHNMTPPHDISDKKITQYLPKGENGEKFIAIMKKSYELLSNHPLNKKRVAEGKNPANSCWFWGEGTKPALESFEKKTSLKGGIISAVDLVKGIGILADMRIIEVEGATGNWDTDFSKKAKACVDNLKDGLDFVYIHMEAPDECGHHGDVEHKIFSIEQISEKVVKYIVEELDKTGEDYKILICPDHPTPISLKTHVSDPIPYVIYSSEKDLSCGANAYDEDEAIKTGIVIEHGYELIQRLINA